mmetsp:Transcript_2150/g.5969  ORF Transcript_2150/g.5969 Transcript_2150/m.5969 type:complete len:107 (-) Transcript_2150:150-470(-)
MLEAELQHGLDDASVSAPGAPAAGSSSWMGSSVLGGFSSLADGEGASSSRFGQGFSFGGNVHTDYREVPLMEGEQQPQSIVQDRNSSETVEFSPPTLPDAPQQSFV